MDIEKYSFLWAEDSGWVLRPHGDSYRIINYGEEGQMSIPGIEDEDIYEAVINKMISAGVKMLTQSEADELFERWQDTYRKKAEKSSKLIKQAEEALKGNQLIKNALRELLDNLDEVESKHPQIHDTMVREILIDTILDHFVLGSSTEDIPSDNYYSMLSDEGDEAVHKALVEVIWKFPLARISIAKCSIQPNGNGNSVTQNKSLRQ